MAIEAYRGEALGSGVAQLGRALEMGKQMLNSLWGNRAKVAASIALAACGKDGEAAQGDALTPAEPTAVVTEVTIDGSAFDKLHVMVDVDDSGSPVVARVGNDDPIPHGIRMSDVPASQAHQHHRHGEEGVVVGSEEPLIERADTPEIPADDEREFDLGTMRPGDVMYGVCDTQGHDGMEVMFMAE